VLAPLDIGDCAFTTQWAVQLAEHLQTAALVLSDQSLGQSRTLTDAPATFDDPLVRAVEPAPAEGYRRYAMTPDGVSPMTLPGTADGMYTADGLEHDERGMPSSKAADHQAQLDKRQHKITSLDYGDHWARIHGEGDLCLVTWGSTSGAVMEAAGRLEGQGVSVRVIALRLLSPLDPDRLRETIADATRTWIVEQNHGGQLFRYLRSLDALPAGTRSLARPGPLSLRPGEILSAVIDQA